MSSHLSFSIQCWKIIFRQFFQIKFSYNIRISNRYFKKLNKINELICLKLLLNFNITLVIIWKVPKRMSAYVSDMNMDMQTFLISHAYCNTCLPAALINLCINSSSSHLHFLSYEWVIYIAFNLKIKTE